MMRSLPRPRSVLIAVGVFAMAGGLFGISQLIAEGPASVALLGLSAALSFAAAIILITTALRSKH